MQPGGGNALRKCKERRPWFECIRGIWCHRGHAERVHQKEREEMRRTETETPRNTKKKNKKKPERNQTMLIMLALSCIHSYFMASYGFMSCSLFEHL